MQRRPPARRPGQGGRPPPSAVTFAPSSGLQCLPASRSRGPSSWCRPGPFPAGALQGAQLYPEPDSGGREGKAAAEPYPCVVSRRPAGLNPPAWSFRLSTFLNVPRACFQIRSCFSAGHRLRSPARADAGGPLIPPIPTSREGANAGRPEALGYPADLCVLSASPDLPQRVPQTRRSPSLHRHQNVAQTWTVQGTPGPRGEADGAEETATPSRGRRGGAGDVLSRDPNLW